jgi:hypothetical protein
VGAHLDPSSCLCEPHTCCYTPTSLDGVTSHKTAIRILRLWRAEILTRMLAETRWPILRFSKEKTLPGHKRRHECTVSVAAILTFVHPEQKTSFREMLQLSKSTSSETWRLSDWKLLYRHGVISLTSAVLPLWQSQIYYFLWEISGTDMSGFGSPVFEVCSTWGSHLSRYAI